MTQAQTQAQTKENQSILAELNKIDALLEGPIPEQPMKAKTKAKTKTKTQAKVKLDVEEVDIKRVSTPSSTSPSVPPADPQVIQAILADLPDIVQTKDLNRIFDFNDGGKYLRRHLRAKFAQDHQHGAPWTWTKDDKQLIAILEFFTTHLTPERKQQLTVIGEDIINEG